MPAHRRSRNLPAVKPAPASDPILDDLLLPASGPNAVPPDRMTPRERREEVIRILARGFLRKARGIPPFVKPQADGQRPTADGTAWRFGGGRVT